MYSSPIVSIIVPCYNSASTIRQTIESVINQTFSDWEMIIVDDCSTDDSAKIIQEYQSRDSRIRYLKTEQPSGSPSMPRNIAIENSRGEWLAMLDSDDAWFPDKLRDQLDFALKKGCLFVYSDYEKMNWDGERGNRIIHVSEKSTYQSILGTNTIPCLTAMIHKNVVKDIRFKHIPKEDYAFWLDVMRCGLTAYNTSEVHALYREQKQSRSSNKLSMIKAQWFVLRDVEKINILRSVFYMFIYLINGFLKYIK